jgi:hypothetical protein
MTTSNDRELRDTMQTQISHLSLSTPVDEILERGDRRRRRRRRGITAGVLATAVLAATGASITLPSGSTPLVPEASAAWGPSMVNLAPDLSAEAGKQCARDLRLTGLKMPADTPPIAGDVRNGKTIVVYRVGTDYGACTFTGETARALTIRSSASGRWQELAPGAGVTLISGAFAQPSLDAPTRDGAGVAQVSAETTRVTVDVSGQLLEAAVDNGVAAFWTPDGTSAEEIEGTVLTAYDQAGDVLSSTGIS